MNITFSLLLLISAFLFRLNALNNNNLLKENPPTIDGSIFTKHVRMLSSDAFEGRKPFTPSEEKSVQYLKTEFEKMGLQPGNGKSYFQDVPMVNITSIPTGPLILQSKSNTTSLKYLDDFVAITSQVHNQVAINNSELVFVGYGIVAPEYSWNDYAGLDVKGKTVVVMVNDPGMIDSTLFKGNTMTYYGRWTYKFEEAARQGAAGVLLIHESRAASYSWAVVRGSMSKPKPYLQTAGNNKSRALLEGWITLESAKKLFQLASVSPELFRQAGQKGFKAVPLGITASLTINTQIKKLTSRNVIALLPGTERPNEHIIYTAHWDHLGKGESIKGDSIYNGAIDNASGTAVVLELAHAFTQLNKKPARSLVFLIVTAEEQGLLGSEYYTTYPIFPLNKAVANINMDMVLPLGRTKDITIIGKGQSELDEYVATEAAKQGRFTRPEFNPSAGLYFRSDHFNFAKVGVPSLFLYTGIASVKQGESWGRAQVDEYNLTRYHTPFDEYAPTWDLSGIVEDMKLLYEIGYRLSNETTFPTWKPGSEFKAAREKMMAK